LKTPFSQPICGRITLCTIDTTKTDCRIPDQELFPPKMRRKTLDVRLRRALIEAKS
jgi:hypothetical protein